jgi:hypothetical protein
MSLPEQETPQGARLAIFKSTKKTRRSANTHAYVIDQCFNCWHLIPYVEVEVQDAIRIHFGGGRETSSTDQPIDMLPQALLLKLDYPLCKISLICSSHRSA